MDGAALDAAQITAISKLPSREVLYGQLVGIVASPITGLARSLTASCPVWPSRSAACWRRRSRGEIPSGDAPAPPPPPRPRPAAEAEDTTTDQDAEAVEPAASSEEPAAADSDEPTETQE